MTLSDINILQASRAELFAQLDSNPNFDVTVIGGGIHGAAFANFAARLGLRVLLLEMSDFAAATSSRSSKMAHGGLRYLEMFDFQQVFEGIKAREELFEFAPHMVKPERFLIPVSKGAWFFKLKLKIGLVLYDLLVKNPAHKHRWISHKNLTATGFSKESANLEGCFEYTDGLMNDSRLVIEHILGARMNSALCLNYAKVKAISHSHDNSSSVSFSDELTGKKIEVKSRLVVNCSGPWAPALQGESKDKSIPRLAAKLSRGVHIIFNKPWTGPSLFLPMPGKARYYFVWPHPGGTMIGTTERETDLVEVDPLPHRDELDEIFARVEKDLPESGLSRSNAHYCFAGIRTLPLRDTSKNSATLSRKHIWRFSDGILTLVGGKYTTAVWTAWEGILEAAKILNKVVPSSAPRDLYPSKISEHQIGVLIERLVALGLSRSHAERIVPRYGVRAEAFLSNADWRTELSPQLLKGELEIAMQVEQAVTVEDVLRRRLDLEYRYGNGLTEVALIAKALGEQTSDYEGRIAKLQALLHA